MSEQSVRELKPKASMTVVDVAIVARELKNLENYLVRTVFMPTRDTLIFELVRDSEMEYLVAEGGRRIHVAKSIYTSESVKTVRPFKKLLEGSKLVEVSQVDFERVVILKFKRGAKLYSLYVELLPRGVVALVNEEGRVVAVNKKFVARDRSVAVGLTYVLPPSPPNFVELSDVEVLKLAEKSSGTLAQFFVRSLGVPPEFINEVFSEEERSTKLSQLELNVIPQLLSRVRQFVKQTVEKPSPCVVLAGDLPIGFFSFKPSKAFSSARIVEFSSMSDLLDYYFKHLDEATLREPELARIRETEAAIEKTLREAEENLEKISKKLSEVRSTLDLLEKYYYEVEVAWSNCRRVVKEKGWSSISECGVVEADSKKGSVKIELPEGVVELLLYKDVGWQYSELKREYEHLSDKLTRAREVIKDLRVKLEDISQRKQMLESLKLRPRRTAWFSRFLWIETSSGFLAIGGRDASQNELIVRRYLGPRDIFMHADIHGASVFAILTRGVEIPERDLREVAQLAASYSKAWKAGLKSVDVFWVRGEQVGLSAPPGEYLSKGSFMVYGQKNFIRSVELVLGIGLIYLDDSYDLLIAPPDLVERKSVVSVAIAPGDMSVESAAKEIRDYFIQKCSDVRGLTARDIAKILPGKVRIVSKK
ncbi:MAG: ribosome rescue protein RqcH [Sulfolobales archaeon]|nr:ribosome rescue protein RqcH [Sulfolobales archaeon]MDW8082496.1 ribosome rescue protein RqcH [Sulfolobales archaeon]